MATTIIPLCRSSNPFSLMQHRNQHAEPDHELWGILPDPCAVNMKRIVRINI